MIKWTQGFFTLMWWFAGFAGGVNFIFYMPILSSDILFFVEVMKDQRNEKLFLIAGVVPMPFKGLKGI